MLPTFWLQIKMSTGMLRPLPAVDSPRLDSEKIESILNDSDDWLTQVSAKSYESKDFDFLGEDEKKKLEEGVHEFQPISVKVKNGGMVTESELKKAKAGYRKILEVMRPDKYDDIEAFVVGKKIENQVRNDLPSWVTELVFETNLNSTGLPALWIWAVVEDQAIKGSKFFEKFREVDQTLTEAASAICPERWTYVRLRTVSEQKPREERRRRARASKK